MQRTFISRLVLGGFLLGAILLGGCSREPLLATYLETNEAALHQPYSDEERPTRFEVASGTPARVIGQNLVEAGLIGDARLFEAYVRINDIAGQLEAGTFVLSPSMTPLEIAEVLQNSQAAGISVTIPEGWRLEQVADFLTEAELLDGDAYRRQALAADLEGREDDFDFLSSRPLGTSLEGYLFPDTYQVPEAEATATDLLQRQLANFEQQVLPIFEEARNEGTTTLDLYTALTLASIVEREAVVPEERPAIARVYLNRLATGMRLEADPTVQYAMGYQSASDQWWKTPVSLAEYSDVDSPYNTYLYAGLPPGPIANPGLDSIRAVLQPEEHDYLYFVATPDGSGAHVFARTWDEHIENVQRYQQGQ